MKMRPEVLAQKKPRAGRVMYVRRGLCYSVATHKHKSSRDLKGRHGPQFPDPLLAAGLARTCNSAAGMHAMLVKQSLFNP